MSWVDDLNAYLHTINPPATPAPSSEDTGPDAIPDNPTPEDCRGGGGFRETNDSSYLFSELNAVAFDSTGMLWAQNHAQLVASLGSSDGPYPAPYDAVKSVAYALRVQAWLDAGKNNDWVGYYASTGNAVLVDIRRAKKYATYNWLCPRSLPKALSFLVTKEPDVVWEQCRPGGGYAILATYWPLYQAAQQRAGGLYGLGAFSIPTLPGFPAIPVPALPPWFGTVPTPSQLYPWVSSVIPGYTSPTEQEVKAAKSELPSRGTDYVGMAFVAIVVAGLAYILLKD